MTEQERKKLNETYDAMLQLLDIMHRQIAAVGNTLIALRDNLPTVSLPDVPDHLLPPKPKE